MKTKIAFICNWGVSSSQLLELYKKQTPDDAGVWENLIGVSNPNEADVIVALGQVQPGIYDPSKIIQFRREPDFIESWKPIEGAKEVFDYSDNKYHVSTWWIDLKWNTLRDLKYHKTKNANIVASSKWQHRREYIQKITNLLPNTFDVYGNVLGNVDLSKNIMGAFHRSVKFSTLIDYKYSVAIENSSQSNYFSEKIIDCMLLWTIPLYWGCPNISEYFPENSYRLLDINDPNQIKEVLERPITEKDIDALREARDLIMYKYNIWPTIQKTI
jgi:hypothetical protein